MLPRKQRILSIQLYQTRQTILRPPITNSSRNESVWPPRRIEYDRKGLLGMKSFLRGVLLGVGIGLLIAPLRGEEMRRLLRDRFTDIRGALFKKEQQASQLAESRQRAVGVIGEDDMPPSMKSIRRN